MENTYPYTNDRVVTNNEIQKRLQSVKYANDAIESIYLYCTMNQGILTERSYMNVSAFYDTWIVAQIQETDKSFFISGARDVDSNPDFKNTKRIISLVRKYPIGANNSQVRGAIVINIDETILNSLIAKRENSMDMTVFITDSAGICLSSGNKDDIYHDFSNESYMRQMASGMDEGYVNEKDRFVFFTTSSYTGWKHISIVSAAAMNRLYSSANRFMFWFVLIILLFAGTALILIFKFLLAPKEQLMSTMAQRIYKAGNNLFDEKLTLRGFELVFSDFMRDYERTKSEIKDYIPVVRQRLVSSVLMGHALDYEVERRRLAYLGVDLSGEAFLVINIEIFSCDARKIPLLLSELCVEIEEIIHQSIQGVAVEQRENTISAILCFPDVDKDKNTITAISIASMLRNHISDTTQCSMAIGMGNVYSDFQLVSKSYFEALEATKHRIFMGNNPIIGIEDIFPPDDAYFQQVVSKGNTMVDFIVSCDFKGCMEKLDEMFGKLRKANTAPEMVYQICMYFIMQSVHKLDVIGVGTPESVYSLNIYEILNSLEDMDSIQNFMCTIMRDFIAQVEKSQVAKTSYTANSELIAKIQTYIQENYAMSDMSQNQIAAEFHLSAPYLSKLFKEFVGINFIDYLIYIRMEAAKSLLQQTDLKANEIAGRVGYNSFPSFIKIFKRYTGKTTGEFRKERTH